MPGDPRRRLYFARMRNGVWWALVALVLCSALVSGASSLAKAATIAWLTPLAWAWHIRNRRITVGVAPIITDDGIRVGSESGNSLRVATVQCNPTRRESQ